MGIIKPRVFILTLILFLLVCQSVFALDIDIYKYNPSTDSFQAVDNFNMEISDFPEGIQDGEDCYIYSSIYKAEISSEADSIFLSTDSTDEILSKYSIQYAYDKDSLTDDNFIQLSSTGSIEINLSSYSTIYLKFRFKHDLQVEAGDHEFDLNFYE